MGRPENNSKILALTQGYAANARDNDDNGDAGCVDECEASMVALYEYASREAATHPRELPHNLALRHAIRTYKRYGATPSTR